VARTSPPGQGKLYAETNGAGKFSVDIPRQTVTGTWQATAGGADLLGPAAVTRNLIVRQTTGLEHVSLRLGPFGDVYVRACLVDTTPGLSRKQLYVPVSLEYARRAGGDWRAFASFSPTFRDDHCPAAGMAWFAKVAAPAHSGYYRLRFAGTDNLRVSVSPPVMLWRNETRITDFSVTPHRVHVHGGLSISGRLWRQVPNGHGGFLWKPYSGHKIAIVFAIPHHAWAYTATPVTNSRGYFSGLFGADITAKYSAVYNGDKTHFGSVTAGIKITVVGGSAQIVSLDHGLRLVL
jgi:hypothetical protein